MLVSFQLASKHPIALAGLFDNLESLAKDPACFEVLVKADIEDPKTQEMLFAEVPKRKFQLKPLITPRKRGYEDLWMAINDLHQIVDPNAYFVCNINDEVRINQQHWDLRLARYVGLFRDDVFRLRTSKLKFRNYHDFWECGFAPEGLGFYTKRWIDICGDWNPCFGPDSSQQYVAYYLSRSNYPSIKQYNRDVPILDLSWRNEGVALNLSEAEQRRRTAINFRLWARQVSHPMQQELYRRARQLQAHIMQAENANKCKIEIVQDDKKKAILLRDATDGELLDILPYKISRVGIWFRNLYRSAHYTYFAGGGRDARNLLPISAIEYLLYRKPSLRTFITVASPRLFVRSLDNRLRGQLDVKIIVSRLQQSFASRLELYRSTARRIFARPLERGNAGIDRYRQTLRVLSSTRARMRERVGGIYKDNAKIVLVRGSQFILRIIRLLPRDARERYQIRRSRWGDVYSRLNLLARLGNRPLPRRRLPLFRQVGTVFRQFGILVIKSFGAVIWIVCRVIEQCLFKIMTFYSQIRARFQTSSPTAAESWRQGSTSHWAYMLRSIFWAYFTIKRQIGALIFVALRRIVQALDATFTGRFWLNHGRRAALALMDQDLRWLKINDGHRARIISSRDPWYVLYDDEVTEKARQ